MDHGHDDTLAKGAHKEHYGGYDKDPSLVLARKKKVVTTAKMVKTPKTVKKAVMACSKLLRFVATSETTLRLKLQPHHGCRHVQHDVGERDQADHEDGSLGGEPPHALRPLVFEPPLQTPPHDVVSAPEEPDGRDDPQAL